MLKEAEIFGGRVVDSSTEGFAIEVTGDPEKLDEFIDVMRSYGEIDVTRSGALAIALEAKNCACSRRSSPTRDEACSGLCPAETACRTYLEPKCQNAITKKTEISIT